MYSCPGREPGNAFVRHHTGVAATTDRPRHQGAYRGKDPPVPQKETNASADVDVITLIMADHREVDRIFELLREDVDARAITVRQLRALMLAHSEAEEAVVYTALKPEMLDQESDETDGDVIDEAFDEHAQMEQLIEDLAGTDPASEEFESILMDVIDSVNHHVEEEEQELLPKLKEICTSDEMAQITQEFYEIRMRVLEDEGGDDLALAPEVLDPLLGVQEVVDVREQSSQKTRQ
jgi:hemerythrin-like domain-containing protein